MVHDVVNAVQINPRVQLNRVKDYARHARFVWLEWVETGICSYVHIQYRNRNRGVIKYKAWLSFQSSHTPPSAKIP